MDTCSHTDSNTSGDNSNGDPTHSTASAAVSNVPEQPQPSAQQEPRRVPLPSPVRVPPGDSGFLAPGVDDPDNILRKPFEDVSSHFTMGEEVGSGQFGVTYVCCERATGLRYACKSLCKQTLGDQSDRDNIRREITIMQHLSGQPNIVEFKRAYEDANSVHLVMELCVGGELFDRMTTAGSFSEHVAAGIFRDIIKAVDVCHFMGVVHRDIRPENFLLTSNDESAMLKAADFGLSVFVEEGKVFTDMVGNLSYVAPEVITRSGHGQEADVWSAGVILYTLLSGYPPFMAEADHKKIIAAVRSGYVDFEGAPWPYISESAKDLIKKMLTQDPKQRITALEALEHPWIRSATDSDRPLDSAVLCRLRQFSAMNAFKKMALKVIAENLSEEDIKGLKQLFINMDIDNSGTITSEELKSGLARLGSQVSEAEVKQLMEAVDIDGNGSIDLVEFITASMHRHRLDEEDNLSRAFQHFDKDNSGFITGDELALAMKEHGAGDDTAMQDIISEVDTDNDGSISYEEFCTMMSGGMVQLRK